MHIEPLQNEGTLIQHRGNIHEFPWVREGRFQRSPRERVLPQKALAWFRSGSEFRTFSLLDRDFSESSPYILGDCPLEAVLPRSVVPNQRAVPAWPIHQILSRLFAQGALLRPDGRYERGVDHGLHNHTKAVFSLLDEDQRRAAYMWIESFWAAPDAVRWRWLAHGVSPTIQ